MINEGCPSISYRIKTEILGETLTEQEVKDYQQRIQKSSNLQKILLWQMPDGYFGTRLHTAPSRSKVWTHEGCVRYLLELGLTEDYNPLSQALDVLLKPGWGKELETSKSAHVFGYELIRASLFAQAGRHHYDFVSQWVEAAVQGFRYIAEASDIYELISAQKNGKYAFKGDIYVPVVYHLRLLAYTDSWRTQQNIKTIKKAYENLYEWLPLPPMYLKSKSQLVAPLSNVAWPINQDITHNKRYGFQWLHFYELSARMGMLGPKSPFRKHFETLREKTEKNDIFVTEPQLQKYMYLGWSGYSGLALEDDWADNQKKTRDFIFRVLLIDHYSDHELENEA
jgi:hypothetical protein